MIGNPKTVPVGQYAEESLRALGLWDRLQPKLVLAENVRQALEYVARGEVDAGFVYTTDAAVRADRVKEAFRPGEDTYRPVLYPVGGGGELEAARARAGLHRAPGERGGAGRARAPRLPAASARGPVRRAPSVPRRSD